VGGLASRARTQGYPGLPAATGGLQTRRRIPILPHKPPNTGIVKFYKIGACVCGARSLVLLFVPALLLWAFHGPRRSAYDQASTWW